MHEYSLVRALLDQVEREAHARGASAVHKLGLKIGALAGVEPELLASAYDVVPRRDRLRGRGARDRNGAGELGVRRMRPANP